MAHPKEIVKEDIKAKLVQIWSDGFIKASTGENFLSPIEDEPFIATLDTIMRWLEQERRIVVDYPGKWIKCEDRLPEIEETVMVTLFHEGYYITEMAVLRDTEQIDGTTELLFHDICHELRRPIEEIVAWQSVPKPYQPKDEGEG